MVANLRRSAEPVQALLQLPELALDQPDCRHDVSMGRAESSATGIGLQHCDRNKKARKGTDLFFLL